MMVQQPSPAVPKPKSNSSGLFWRVFAARVVVVLKGLGLQFVAARCTRNWNARFQTGRGGGQRGRRRLVRHLQLRTCDFILRTRDVVPYQELELLVPDGRAVAAGVRGVVVAAAVLRLRAQRQPAPGVAGPGEAPHWQRARLYQRHLQLPLQAEIESPVPAGFGRRAWHTEGSRKSTFSRFWLCSSRVGDSTCCISQTEARPTKSDTESRQVHLSIVLKRHSAAVSWCSKTNGAP